MTYEHYKKLWHDTKPIRGRAEDVRPIGQRRRDWERIMRVHLPNDDDNDAYSAYLYNTHVVTYYPDGLVELRCETWSTPTTAEFITAHSPVHCVKKAGRLWVSLGSVGNEVKIPIPEQGALQIRENENGWYAIGADTIKQRAIDRAKMKEARDRVRPFLQWAKAFMSMSDGWLMDETRAMYSVNSSGGWGHVVYDYGFSKGIQRVFKHEKLNSYERSKYGKDPKEFKDRYDYEGAFALLCSEDIATRFRVLFTITNSLDSLQTRLVKEDEKEVIYEMASGNPRAYKAKTRWHDLRYKFDQIEYRITKILKANEDVYRIVEHAPSSCIRENVVV